MNYLLYDCRCIPSKISKQDAYEYCKGWGDYAGMGISVVGLYASWLNAFQLSHWVEAHGVSLSERIAEFTYGKPLIVGFNSRGFDDKLMAANGISMNTDYDILEEVRIAAGFEAHWQSVPKGYSYKLDAIAHANGMAKTGSGELAPILWQQGKHREVIDYCLMDVKITQQVLELGLAGELVDPNTGKKLQLAALG